MQEAKDVIDFEAQEDDLARAMEWLEAQVGRSYAFWEIVLIALFGRLPNSWACPSLTTAFLRIAGPLKDGLNDRTETPSGIAERLGRVPPPGFEPGTSSV